MLKAQFLPVRGSQASCGEDMGGHGPAVGSRLYHKAEGHGDYGQGCLTYFCWRNCHKWPFVHAGSQISAILGGLEGHILRKKRRIYESLTSSVQNDLKPCYEGGAPEGGSSLPPSVCTASFPVAPLKVP